jgi:hypothetical protein
MDQIWEHKDTKQTSKFTTITLNYFHKCQRVYIHRLLFKIGQLVIFTFYSAFLAVYNMQFLRMY